MEQDISRRALLVLVIIAIVISIFTTAIVMNTVYNFTPSAEPSNDIPTGRVTLLVPAQPTASGKVSLYVPPEKE